MSRAAHGPRLNVDLDAFAQNLRSVARRVGPATPMVVMKNDAYGHGVAALARRAGAEGVRWFGALEVDTAREVRAAVGPDAGVFVWLVADADDAGAAVELGLDIGVGDRETLDEVADAARRDGATAKVHLKIDTGLRRSGVRPEEWPAFVARAHELARAGRVEIVGVWSHLAEASDRDDDDARTVFDNAASSLETTAGTPLLRHLSASAAAFARPEFRYDLVRVGAFAYGIRPAHGPSDAELGIRPVAALTAPVVAVGDTVVAAIGALHGVPSILAGRVEVGTPVGRRPLLAVGADRIDVGRWPEALVGDEVTIFGGSGPGATELAEAIGTVGEEIVLRVGDDVPRVYS